MPVGCAASRSARSEQVDRRRAAGARIRRSERQAADRPHVLLELAGDGGLDRPVAAVVDARRELVHDERAVGHEEQLDRQECRPGPSTSRGPSRARPRPRSISAGIAAGRGRLDEDPAVVHGCARAGRSRLRSRRRSARHDHESSASNAMLALEEQPPAEAADASTSRARLDVRRYRRSGPGSGRRSRRATALSRSGMPSSARPACGARPAVATSRHGATVALVRLEEATLGEPVLRSA